MLKSRAKNRVPGPPPDTDSSPVSRFADSEVVDVEAREPAPAPQPTPADAEEPIPAAKKPGLFQRAAKSAAAPAKAVKRGKRSKPASSAPPPVQLLIGYLPEVTARDAMEYALGMADKHLIQPGLGYVGVFAFGEGFVYELQEGGSGRAFIPEVLQFFTGKGPWHAGESLRVVLPTASRKVEIVRTRVGLESALLPESAEDPLSPLEPTDKLTSLVPRREGLFWAGAAVFLTGAAMAVASGTYFRLQGYAAPPKQPIEQISTMSLPHMQYQKLEQAHQRGDSVGALKFENKTWTLVGPEAEPARVPTAPGAAE